MHTPDSQQATQLSVVIPVFNEADNLAPLHAELLAALNTLDLRYEIIYVDDGSTDASRDQLGSLVPRECVMIIDLRRNFGQTAALAAGIDHASGDIVILMDGDRQNDPADIPRLLARLKDGYDVVSGWRRKRQDHMVSRIIPSMLANILISHTTGIYLHDYGCTLKAYRREVLREVPMYGEMHRFIPAFIAAAGGAVTEIEVNHRPRTIGKSKYGLERTLKVILDLITVKYLLSYHSKPMHFFGTLGLGLIVAALLVGGVAIAHQLVNEVRIMQTPLPIIAATLLIIGVQSILHGLGAEQMIRTQFDSQAKPAYVIRSITRS